MFDRTRIVSKDLAAARRFYAATARSLGLAIIEAEEDSVLQGALLPEIGDGSREMRVAA